MPPTYCVRSSAGWFCRKRIRSQLSSFSFGDQTFDAIEKGRLDLMLNADDGYLRPRFVSEVIFDDSFSCVAAKESTYPRTLTLKQYLAAEHVGVGIWDELQTLPDKRLAGIGAKRRCPIWVP